MSFVAIDVRGRPSAPACLPRQQEIARERRWKITANDGSVIAGHLPGWAQEDPSANSVPANELPALLVDVSHWADFDGAGLLAFTTETGGADGPLTELQVFGSSIVCHPYPDPQAPGELRTPYVEVQITPDHWMTGLDPDAITALATNLRTLAERFEHHVRPRLDAARADWAAHHTSAEALASRPAHTEERESA